MRKLIISTTAAAAIAFSMITAAPAIAQVAPAHVPAHVAAVWQHPDAAGPCSACIRA